MRAFALLSLLLTLVAGCTGSRRAEVAPDERYGDRVDEAGGRVTMVLAEPDTSVSFFRYPAVYDTVHIRSAPFDPTRSADVQEVPVEVLVKGALPDACMELDDVHQQRIGHIVNMELTMRRPQGAVCAGVVRPYRFYVQLEGLYGPGAYILRLNNRVHAFEVRPSERAQSNS